MKANVGFTIVELMVVLALVTVLTVVAVPQYTRHEAKARQAEAKVALSTFFDLEQTFFATNGNYSTCLKQLGYLPASTRNYYAKGFSSFQSNCGTGVQACSNYIYNGATALTACANSDMYIAADSAAKRQVPACSASWPASLCASLVCIGAGACLAGRDSFIAGAIGYIYSTTLDEWSIDHNKVLQNWAPGI